MKMGFHFNEVQRLSFGEWLDFFDTYKIRVHNVIMQQGLFPEPSQIASLRDL